LGGPVEAERLRDARENRRRIVEPPVPAQALARFLHDQLRVGVSGLRRWGDGTDDRPAVWLLLGRGLGLLLWVVGECQQGAVAGGYAAARLMNASPCVRPTPPTPAWQR